MKTSNKISVWIVSAVFMFLVSGCGGKTFLKKNLDSFREFKLKNGIPVVVKLADHNQIKTLVVSLDGGSSVLQHDKGKLEEITLSLAQYESEKYPNLKKRVILQETSSSIGHMVGLDSSMYEMKAIDMYFDRVFDLYADLFLHPTFNKKYFKEVKTNALNSYRQRMTDGYDRVSNAINSEYLKGHPYYSTIETPKTISGITLDDIKNHYKKMFVAARMKIFAVGNYDVDALKEKLDSTFGNITKGKFKSVALPGFSDSRNIPLVLDPYKDLRKDVSYVRCNFLGPDAKDRDYWSTLLAFTLLRELMGNIVRTKHALVYSTFAFTLSKKSNYSNISAFKTSDPVHVIKYMKEAIDVLASGRCMAPTVNASAAGKGGMGEGKGGSVSGESDDYIDIASALDFYKASFETSYFQGVEDNLSIARKMTHFNYLVDDYKGYLYAVSKIRGITAEDVKRAAIRYIKNPVKYCAVSANPSVIAKLKKDHSLYSKKYKVIKIAQ